MNISVTGQARRFLQDQIGDRPAIIKLVYDTEGCGCGVNGIPALWLVSEQGDNDMKLHSDTFSFVIDRLQAMFFEDNLVLGSEPNYPSFRLSGDGQLYGQNIRFVDKRS